MAGCKSVNCWIEKPSGQVINMTCKCLRPLGKENEQVVKRKLYRLQQLEDENRRLRKALHDAIERPMGVVPDSALEFWRDQ